MAILYPARARSARARRACALRALGLLLADGAPTVSIEHSGTLHTANCTQAEHTSPSLELNCQPWSKSGEKCGPICTHADAGELFRSSQSIPSHSRPPGIGLKTQLSSPRAKRAGPKGLRAESARAVTGRRCPHSGVG